MVLLFKDSMCVFFAMILTIRGKRKVKENFSSFSVFSKEKKTAVLCQHIDTMY